MYYDAIGIRRVRHTIGCALLANLAGCWRRWACAAGFPVVPAQGRRKAFGHDQRVEIEPAIGRDCEIFMHVARAALSGTGRSTCGA